MLLFLAIWIVLKPKFSLISIISILIAAPNIQSYFGFNFSSKHIVENKKQLSILSYNVKVFDLYNWTKNITTGTSILNAILDIDADIVCLQEFYSDNSENFNMLKKLSFKYPYVHFENTLTLRGTQKWGMATFSKYPITKKERIEFPNVKNNLAIVTDIFFEQHPIKIFNVHLQSIHLQYNEMEQLENLQDSMTLPSLFSILKKMKYAYYWRAIQAELLSKTIRNVNFPIIVCGDFNDTPNSYTYKTLKGNLKDAFLEAGNGIGHTFKGIFPVFRIDYILANNNWEVQEYTTLRKKYSDHDPINSILIFKEP